VFDDGKYVGKLVTDRVSAGLFLREEVSRVGEQAAGERLWNWAYDLGWDQYEASDSEDLNVTELAYKHAERNPVLWTVLPGLFCDVFVQAFAKGYKDAQPAATCPTCGQTLPEEN
jgi:hypothetical protein